MRRLQLGPAGGGDAILPTGTPTHPRDLINADLNAIRAYVGLDLEHSVKSGFRWLGEAQPGGWRAGPGREEVHQDFLSYQRNQKWRKVANRRVLVLRPVGPWPADRRHLIGPITKYLMLFFQRPVRWEDPVALPPRYRLNFDGAAEHLQYAVGPILDRLHKRVPDDALAVVGITHVDLYPAPNWGFVFGMADLEDRVAVVSTSRLYPKFWGQEATPKRLQKAQLRLLRVLAHEVSHTLGLHHCHAFRCNLNGCNSLAEHDRAPSHLCPACMAKLAWRLDLRVRARYGGLAHLFHKLGYPTEASWYRKQLLRLSPLPPAQSSSAAQTR